MSAITAEMEMELENELAHEGEEEFEMEAPVTESEYEYEYEAEGEAEMEQEAFFNHLAGMADRGGRSQALRRIGLSAARQALRSYLKNPPLAVEGEGEFEDEAGFEMEAEANPLQAAHANAIMEHLSHQASTAESEDEAAEQFLPLIPLAAKVVMPMAAKLGARVLPHVTKKLAPHLTRGVAHVAKSLFRSHATRPLLRTLPTIAKRTMAALTRHAAHGRRVTPRAAIRTLALQTARTLGHPRHAVAAFRRSKALDHRYHLAARRFTGRPSGPVGAARHPAFRWSHPGWRPGRYRGAYQAPGRTVYHAASGRGAYYTGGRGPIRSAAGVAPSAAVAPVVPGAACQCFRPVSCATCGSPAGVCPTCRR